MHVKPPDDACLLQLTPTVWWETEEKVYIPLFQKSDDYDGHGYFF